MSAITSIQRELNFGDYFRLLMKNRYILLFSVLAFLVPTWWFLARIPDYYIASSQIVMDQAEQNPFVMLENQPGQKNIGYYRAILQSQAFQDKLATALTPALQEAKIKGNPRSYIFDKILLTEGSVESFISIQCKTPSPKLSYAMVKEATDSLIVFCRKVENEEAEKAIVAMKEQIEVCVAKRDEIQAERNKMADVSKLANQGDLAGLNALEKSFQDELVKFELDKANLEAKKNYFQSLDAVINKPAKSGNDSVLNALKAQMRALEKEKEKMVRLGVSLSPESKINQDLAATEEKMAKLTKKSDVSDINVITQWQQTRKEVTAGESEMQMKKARLDAFKKAIVSYRESHPDLGKQQFEIQQLDNLLERYLSTHKRLTERLEDAVIQMESKSGGLKLVDSAQLPVDPVPRKDLIVYLVSLIVGLGFGIGLSLLREFMDDTVKSPDDIEKQLGLTLLGTIPHIVPKKSDLEVKRTVAKGKKAMVRNKYPELMMGMGNEESIASEAYRSLRTNIVFSSPDKQIQTMLITSSGPAEGKSLTMANTALSFAQQGEPTLIIDTDLRRPVIHHLFGLNRGPGFGEMFTGTNTMDEVIRSIPGTELKLITAGAYMPNPAELLGSKKMDSFLDELKKRFRYVLFDTPPIFAVTDAAILANKLDGVVLVVRSNKTSFSVCRRTLQSLKNVNARVLGCILNDVDLTKGYNSYGYYKHYYHYYQTKKD